MPSIVQIAQSNDFHLVSSAILRTEKPARIIRVAPRNTEAITSRSEEGRPKQLSSRRREEPELRDTYGEAEETKPKIKSMVETKSEMRTEGVTSEWLKVSSDMQATGCNN